MKTMKNGLVAAALALTGCAAAKLRLRDLAERDFPSESFTYQSRNCDPYNNEVKLDFRSDGYEIECDFNHYFTHDAFGNFLKWGELRYADRNLDGIVDEVNASYIQIQLNESLRLHNRKIQLRYTEVLGSLEQSEIDNLWLERWR